ncbi:MAG: nitrogenase-stabilizing/protective protein NifW [Leptolyngbyaceae cyanobacterium]
MVQTLAVFNTLTTAEEYLEFFELPYDSKVVSVNRLHILKKFSEFVQEIDQEGEASEVERLGQYKIALQNAYNLFLTSNSVEQKLFKVFQEKPGNVVMMSEIS